ncbi:succinate-semialdehyde dehydrogenase, mitochondrial-like isoform X1 [Macrosteles quadrilineatus]|uniref:succinate-semialdehyde dehydrogenase, mitochondrial-like isoform X1 n=2 Tax=Macrosteles quadrilineatus TaxID=74068 RepID=UPI0023E2BE6C|nr:succinate-semialdehyde dehydrogenase, mitochondrial-like isoform X1 [Macrosteles quadrilineatus]
MKGSNMKLITSLLPHSKGFVNGEWVDALSGHTFTVSSPSTGEVLTSVPDMVAVDCELAIAAADNAFKSWSSLTAKERAMMLRRWYNVLDDHSKDLAHIMTAESGKPLNEAMGEVAYGNSFVEWFSEEARRINGEVVPSPANKQLVFIKQPIGVVSLITPWNFPHAMITRKAAAALAAGCTCVIKPAEDTPLTALALAYTVQLAGFPKGVFNVVTCTRANAAEIGRVLCQSPSVAGLSFTGSTEVGKLLYNQCAVGVKRVSLELGGNAPFIVFNTADIERAVDCAMAAKFRNCGQACISPNRFFIHNDVFESFVEKMVKRIHTDIKLGDGFDPNTTTGPLINDAQVAKVTRIVDDAIAKGAKVHCGGKRALEVGDKFFHPTLLTNVTSDMLCTKEEIFGPVVVCMRFSTEGEAVQQANNTSRGLAGYFFTNDVSQAWRVAKNLEVGMVGINESLISSAEIAFGGIKESGLGREGSHHGIEEFTYIKSLCFGNA